MKIGDKVRVDQASRLQDAAAGTPIPDGDGVVIDVDDETAVVLFANAVARPIWLENLEVIS